MKDIKELYELLDASTNDTDRMNILFDIATFFLNTNEQRMVSVNEEIRELAERMDSNMGRCYYHSTRGRMFYRKSQYHESAAEFQKALDLSLLTDDLLMQAMCYDSVGAVCAPLHQYDKALEMAFKALALYEQIPTKAAQWQKAVCYNNIGVAYKKINELDKAEENLLKGLAVNEMEPNARMEHNLQSNLGDLKLAQGKYDEGINRLLPAIAGFKKLNHKVGEVHATVLMAHGYLGKGDFAVAMQYYIHVLKLLKGVEHKLIEVHAMRGIGNVYVAMQAYPEAIGQYEKALAVASTIGDYKEMCELHLCIGKAHLSLQQPEKAKQAFFSGIQLATEKQLLKELDELESYNRTLQTA